MAREMSARQSSIAVRMGVGLASLVALLAVGGCLLAVGRQAFRDRYADRYLCVEASPDSIVWLHFRGQRVWAALTAAALEHAAWTEGGEIEVGNGSAPRVSVGFAGRVAAGRTDEGVNVTLNGEACRVEWRMTRRDEGGMEWEYVFERSVVAAGMPDDAPVVSAPDLNQLALWLDVRLARDDGKPAAQIATGLSCGGFAQVSVANEAGSPEVRVEVSDSEGNMVSSRTAPLTEWGYT
jgi:hypothetical protein